MILKSEKIIFFIYMYVVGNSISNLHLIILFNGVYAETDGTNFLMHKYCNKLVISFNF